MTIKTKQYRVQLFHLCRDVDVVLDFSAWKIPVFHKLNQQVFSVNKSLNCVR